MPDLALPAGRLIAKRQESDDQLGIPPVSDLDDFWYTAAGPCDKPEHEDCVRTAEIDCPCRNCSQSLCVLIGI
jgi:hypothetical protein